MFRDVEISPTVPAAFVSLADVKAYLSIAGAGSDALLTSLLNVASQQIEAYCGTVITQRTVTERMRLDCPERSLSLRYAPAISLTSLSYDGVAETVGEHRLAKALGVLRRTTGGEYGDGADWLAVYTAGFAAVPEPIAQAARDLVKFLYNNSSRDETVARVAVPDVSDVTYAEPHMVTGPSGVRIPGSVADQLEPYVLRYSI